MSAAPVLRPWTPYGGECWRCHAGDAASGWAVPLEPMTMLCWPCHDADLAEYRARMADTIRALQDDELSRLDHLESCPWCADVSGAHGRIPPMYRCPQFARTVLAMAAVGTEAA